MGVGYRLGLIDAWQLSFDLGATALGAREGQEYVLRPDVSGEIAFGLRMVMPMRIIGHSEM